MPVASEDASRRADVLKARSKADRLESIVRLSGHARNLAIWPMARAHRRGYRDHS
jgi:hypothetical protein